MLTIKIDQHWSDVSVLEDGYLVAVFSGPSAISDAENYLTLIS